MSNKELLKALLANNVRINSDTHLKSILDDPTCKISDDINEFDVLYVLGTTEIQMNTTRNGNKKTFGFDELKKSLKFFDPNEKVLWITVLSADWIGRCIVNRDKTELIGCAFVESPPKTRLKTPPNWDGTEEMLMEYNKNRED